MRKRNINLKSAIFARGITQRHLADTAGIPESQISMMVNGRYVPDQAQMERISKTLGVPARELFEV